MTLDVAHVLDRLAAELAESAEATGPGDPSLTGDAELFIWHEARLLDERRLDAWLSLCADDVVYWVPADVPAADPRGRVTLALDDRRRLEDRVAWLTGGLSFTQDPPWRTARHVTNVEAVPLGNHLLVRSVFTIAALRHEETLSVHGRYEHRLVDVGGSWRIRTKRVELLDADRHRRNLVFVL
ncbi:MAG TPA: aromatic-ring-hydroxylating dioxygenase subunit beta [Acidimicrobiales bacterium]|nr:aromatic-ring-hydroxylating dioxygenase subunit beta [Acidimicrobiales bacterium]